MENETPFDLEAAIAKWRGRLTQSSGLRAEQLEELELHLRDSVSTLQKRGLSQDEACVIALRRLGHLDMLKKEFAKVTSPVRRLGTASQHFIAAMQMPSPTTSEILRRIILMERDIALPVKTVAIVILLYSFYSSPWFTNVSTTLEIGVATIQNLLWGCVAINLIAGVLISAARRLPLAFLQGVVFAVIMLDGVFALTIAILLGSGETSYWLFPALLVRATVSVPKLSSQILLWLTLIICFALASFIENGLIHYMDDASRFFMGYSLQGGPQPILLRIVLLCSVAVCCWTVQRLLQQRHSDSHSIADD